MRNTVVSQLCFRVPPVWTGPWTADTGGEPAGQPDIDLAECLIFSACNRLLLPQNVSGISIPRSWPAWLATPLPQTGVRCTATRARILAHARRSLPC